MQWPDLTKGLKDAISKAVSCLKGPQRRMAMARFAQAVGGQRAARRMFGWDREVIRKGAGELQHGPSPTFHPRRKPHAKLLEQHPELKKDLREVIDPKTHAEPRKRDAQAYCPSSVSRIVQQLVEAKGYNQAALPSDESIRQIVNSMDYTLRRVQKTKPLKKVPEADAIFANVHELNQLADSSQDDEILRISADTKARIPVGEFDRGGLCRVDRKALDHDFPSDIVVPMGLFVPKYDELYIDLCPERATADTYVDSLIHFWNTQGHRFPSTHTLLLNCDCGPENNSHRTQFMARLVDFVDQTGLQIILAYYPPYQSKYNPIERCWAVLENLWRGDLLDSVNTVYTLASQMTYNGVEAIVRVVDHVYQKGISLSKKAMASVQARLRRSETLPKYHVSIPPTLARQTS
jgi:hypothetical protein